MKRRLHLRGRKTSLGAYAPNHLLIELGADAPYLHGGDPPKRDTRHRHIFVHEYWHYLQNVTTVSGFKGFAFTQHVVSHFTHSLSSGDGSSTGNLGIGEHLRVRNATLTRLHLDVDGDVEPYEAWADDVVDFHIVSVREDRYDQVFGGRPAPNPLVFVEVECTVDVGGPHTSELLLGTAAIEESVAYLVEERVRSSVGESPEDPPPPLPYLLVQRLLEYVLGHAPDDWVPAALGTLSLLAPHPGKALLFAARAFAVESKRGTPDDEAVEIVCKAFKNQIYHAVSHIERFDLPELVTMHHGRGYMEHALKHIGRTFSTGLHHRLEDPLFDARAVFRPTDVWNLEDLERAYPPCDVLQERADDAVSPRDIIYSLGPEIEDDSGLTASEVTRVFQAQQDYVYAHLRDEEFVESAETSSRCPYFDACSLEHRATHEDDCRNAPWRAYEPGETGCFYSVAVAGTIGLVEINKKAE